MKYAMLAISVWVEVYTFSYGLFEWQKENRSGAVAVWFLCALTFGAFAAKLFL